MMHKHVERLWVHTLRDMLFLALLISMPLMARPQLEPNFCAEYTGKLGTDTIGMALHSTGSGLAGSYFFRSDLKDLSVGGEYLTDRDVVLRDNTGNTFHLRFVEDDPAGPIGPRPLTSDILKGSYIRKGDSSNVPVFLRMDHGGPGSDCSSLYDVGGAKGDALIEQNVQAFYSAVLKGNKLAVARYIAYPLNFINGKRSIIIKDQAQFLRDYDAIFTKEFIARIAAGIPHHMFANWEGIMLSDGAVWFNSEGKVDTFIH